MRAYKFLDAHFGIKSLTEKRLKISRLPDLNDPFELIPYNLADRRLRRALLTTRDQIATNRGILCFCRSWRDPVTWAHYSDKHKGLCLGFEIPDEKCKAVNYVAKRLPFPAQPTVAEAETMLFTKYINWKYEQEVRVWVALNDRENNLYFSPFGEELRLAEVIAGARCSLSKVEIVQALGPLAGATSVIKARAGFREYEVVRDKRGFSSKG